MYVSVCKLLVLIEARPIGSGYLTELQTLVWAFSVHLFVEAKGPS